MAATRGEAMSRLRILAASLLLLAGSACGSPQGTSSGADVSELEAIATRYKVPIAHADPGKPVKTTHGMIRFRQAGEQELARYVPLFAFEFGLYPPSLVKQTKLRRVVLCKGLSFDGQRRNAIPDYENDVLYLDVGRGVHSKPYLRKVIHHEFYHLVDYRDDGLVYTDERWSSLNRSDFKYGTGGRAAQDDATMSLLTDKVPGFLSRYATTAVEEDKAEVFAHLMTDSSHVEERARKDRVLLRKVERMKELMRSFCPDVGDDFWEGIRKVKRPGN
jgi:hypothetical protein